MARIVYEALQKPLDVRLIEGACIYYEVEREFFCKKKGRAHRDKDSDKRRLLFHLLHYECDLELARIAELFGFKYQTVDDCIKTCDFRRSFVKCIGRDMEEIKKIAMNLDAKLVIVDVKLEQFLREPPVV